MADPSACIKRVEHRGNARAPYAEHLRQKFMRKMDLVIVAAVMSHEQPARQALLDGRVRISQGRVRKRKATDIGIAKQGTMKRPTGT